MPRLPPYFDRVLAAFHAGRTGRDVHLGYWDDPPPLTTPCAPAEFLAAQNRLTRRVLARLSPRAGDRVLDVGCGLGGTIAALRNAGAAVTGTNIDHRQLSACRPLGIPLAAADACALPFAPASFDHITCVEAMFHFPTRAAFLAEAARVLRGSGTLIATDILLHPPPRCPWPAARIAAILDAEYGPWPQPWQDLGAIRRHAQDVGLPLAVAEDWTAATLPSYRMISPDPWPERRADPDAGAVFRWLHGQGGLSYHLLMFRRSPR